MSSLAMIRTWLIEASPSGLRLPHRVAQFPLAAGARPEMGRAEGVGQSHEVVAVHQWGLEHLRSLRKLPGRNAEVAEDFLGESLRELTVVAAHQGHAFVARDVAGPDFLRRVVGRTADAELGEGGVVVEIVDAVVDAVVLAVRARGALGRSFEA